MLIFGTGALSKFVLKLILSFTPASETLEVIGWGGRDKRMDELKKARGSD